MIQNATEDCESMVISQLILQNRLTIEQSVVWFKDLERRDKTAASFKVSYN